jgi:hypothetical protein
VGGDRPPTTVISLVFSGRRFSVAQGALLGGTTLLIGHGCSVLVGAITFLLRLSPSLHIAAGAAAVGALIWAWFAAHLWFARAPLRAFVIISLVLLLLVGLTVLTSGRFYDLSADGQTYHQRAILRLARGWNPVYEPSQTGDDRIDHYVWGAWLPPAASYTVTGHMEPGKALPVLLVVSAFSIALAALLMMPLLTVWQSLALALAVALNPVSVTQLFSFMVDGQMAALIAIAVFLGLFLFLSPPDQSRSRLLWIALGTSAILLINTKLTGVIYAVVVLGGMGLAFAVLRRERLLAALGTSVAALIVGVFVVGTPLISNALHKGTPFYPALGTESMAGQRPPNFEGRRPVDKLLLSLFSRSQPRIESTQYKIPFTFTRKELAQFVNPDVRVSGFGPLFGGVMLLSVLLAIVSMVRRRPAVPAARFIAFLMVTIWASVLINPEAWWARFVPQLWLFPLLAVMNCFLTPERSTRWLGVLVLALVLANGVVVVAMYMPQQYTFTRIYAAQLDGLRQASQFRPVTVYFSNFYANRIRFDAAGVQYTSVAAPPNCETPIALRNSETIVCP